MINDTEKIAFYHTIIIKIGERKVIVAILVTTIETYVMCMCPLP